MTDPLLYRVDDGLARITLNRPQRMNAFNAELAYAWADATARATTDSTVGAILLEGEGRGFCAGGDVVDMATRMAGASDIERLAKVINSGIVALTSSSVPVVAAAHGTTAGGGLGILLSSDYAVIGTDSKLGSRYANIGLTPDLSVSAQLERAVGERRALQLLLSDRLLPAREAVEWGIAAEAIGEGDADEIGTAVRARAEEVARFWLSGAFGAYGQAKRLIRSRPDRTFAQQLDEEARTIAEAFGGPEAQGLIAAFAGRSGAR
ncbi:enoyl-CoA hydratase/isomerase family protein [Microbacterium capsulatum]|uniref:Enoyl-CoA hydratase/isomerase family protein n=1 Tax=Microbacterium capsulatum TaxID=3041921 RepID=A0ABU0XF63_9MICO|nr:enoyl-CoA hydratase/isomerase family protein [Microbacterium sp. ASV81]MDQ4213761.1 enoyl-CoA hydratase/isomerase family protein [Microbacterium sp. ASV81]